MARTWLSIEVELVAGRGEYYWPRPGRVFVARRAFTFRQLAEAINVGFGRWELAHLHRFVLEDGTEIVPLEWWDDPPTGAVDDSTRLSILEPGQQFAYEFDLGDGWEHVCTVAPERVDPVTVYGTEPPEPAVYFGWGDLPDQHGRRFREDDGSTAVPPQPDPPTADLPPVLPRWGDWQPPSPDEQRAWLAPGREWDEESWRALSGAVARGDGRTVVDVLRRRDPTEVAQLAGDGLLTALDQRIEEAYPMARRLAEDLRRRMLPGDTVLADELDAARGAGPEPDLEPVPVDLEELAMCLEGDPLQAEGWRIDVRTGRWWPQDPVALIGEEPPDHWEHDDRWLSVTPVGSRDAWQDMNEFIDQVEDGGLAERLDRAIRGRGAFRRFKDILSEHPELRDAWFRFSDDRQRGRAREWLAIQGYRPQQEAPDDDGGGRAPGGG